METSKDSEREIKASELRTCLKESIRLDSCVNIIAGGPDALAGSVGENGKRDFWGEIVYRDQWKLKAKAAIRKNELAATETRGIPHVKISDFIAWAAGAGMSEARAILSSVGKPPRDREPTPVSVSEVAPGTSWKDISISFPNDEMAIVSANGVSTKYSYAEMGFETKLNKIASYWNVLRTISGENPISCTVNYQTNRDIANELRKRLKQFFPAVEGNPFKKDANGWYPVFTVIPYEE